MPKDAPILPELLRLKGREIVVGVCGAIAVYKVADLVSKSESELLKVRSFGRTSLREVERKLEELNMKLGTPLPDGFVAEVR